MKNLKIVSPFDGISCGMMAFQQCNFPIDEYIAFEIDDYAIKISEHNFPQIIRNGDVFQVDFSKYEGCDFVIGGSPCTHWSIAQKKDRETTASGMGWELFQQFVRAINESKPRFFLYENNKSMSKAIKKSISDSFGFEPICINSELVSSQNRNRLYWVGVRQEDGTYKKADISQPDDLHITIDEIFDHDTYAIGKPIRIPDYGNNEKFRPAEALYSNHTGTAFGSIRQRLFSEKSYKQQEDLVAVPINKETYQSYLSDPKVNVYYIKDGCLIYENGKYPISLQDGYYLFRRLSVNEYKKIQTIPDDYDFSVVSNGRAYRGIGNGWTVNVIAWILKELDLKYHI